MSTPLPLFSGNRRRFLVHQTPFSISNAQTRITGLNGPFRFPVIFRVSLLTKRPFLFLTHKLAQLTSTALSFSHVIAQTPFSISNAQTRTTHVNGPFRFSRNRWLFFVHQTPFPISNAHTRILDSRAGRGIPNMLVVDEDWQPTQTESRGQYRREDQYYCIEIQP